MNVRQVLAVVLGSLAATMATATDFDRVRIVGEQAHLRTETPHPVPLAEADEVVWRDVFTWPHASYIAVHFERFDLAPGERVVVRTPDGSHAYTFEGEGKAGSDGTFWATHVPGDTCEVLYYGNGRRPGWGYVVDRFAHGFPDAPAAADQFETICGEDDGDWAKCYEESEPEIYENSRSIARLLINGVAGCTGWLVGCEGHLMTNAHCITNPVDALNTDYEFMAEGPTCETNCGSGFGACPGIVAASSGTLVQAGTQATLDYALVQLPASLAQEYGFFKLRPEGPAVDERIYLNGHPAGWGKRFQILSSDPTDESGYCEIRLIDSPPAPGCSALGPPEAGYMCDTQSGSSGSPVVAYSDHRVVVLHHCGGCENTGVLIQDVIADLGANLPACSIEQLDGLVQLDQDTYGCAGTAGIVVRDDSLVGAGTQDVTIQSTSETTPETVTLTETPADSGTFRGGVLLTTDGPASGDGELTVAAGDSVTVVYIDADDGQGGMNVPRTDTAGVDCRAPEITNLAATRVTGEEATIGWTTDEPATSAVRYGPTTHPTSEESSMMLVTSHDVDLAGLTPCTPHFFSARSQDAAGNVAEDDNGGAFHTVTTASHHRLEHPSTDTPVTIPDNDPQGTTSTIHVDDNVTVADVNVEIDITHTYDGDIEIFLVTPTGTEILLADMRGDDGDDYRDTVFDDEAASSIVAGTPPFTGSFRPEKPLGLADGIPAAGDWSLKVVDLGPTDFGTIDGWTLMLSYAGGCGVSLSHESSLTVDTCRGTGSGGDNDIVDPGEEIVLSLTLRNDGTTPLSGVVASLSTGTPGVYVTRPTATFPDVAEGETASSDPPHFALVVGSSVACGEPIDLVVDGWSSEGAVSAAFDLMVGASGSVEATYESADVPRPVPDLITVTSTVDVADTEPIRDVDVEMSITHTYVSDLDVFLIGPDGTRVELTSDNGGSGDNYTGTIFDDEAATPIDAGTAPFSGRFRPEAPLSSLDGIPADGTWTLEITDDTLQDPGVLESWSVTLTTGPDVVCDACVVAPPAGEVTGLLWAAGPPTRMAWDPADGSFYNVYRGQPGDLASLQGPAVDSCLRTSVTAADTGETLTELPAPGSFFWYLVRAANAGGEGPAGASSAAARQQDSSGSCP